MRHKSHEENSVNAWFCAWCGTVGHFPPIYTCFK
nr:MAG TPA: activity-regulated cytoskeleton associated protein 1 [Caudoviricetes sp.]